MSDYETIFRSWRETKFSDAFDHSEGTEPDTSFCTAVNQDTTSLLPKLVCTRMTSGNGTSAINLCFSDSQYTEIDCRHWLPSAWAVE